MISNAEPAAFDHSSYYGTLNITSTGSITASGSVALNLIGYGSFGIYSTILNQGTITLTGGTNSSAVFAQTGADIKGTSFTNEGSISNTVTSNSSASGLNLKGVTGGTITNTSTGTITVNASGGTGAFGWGMNFDGLVSEYSTVKNEGTIAVDSTGDAVGIRLSNTTSSINSSTILNSGTIEIEGNSYSYGIFAHSVGYDSIINNTGDISVTGPSYVAMGIRIADLDGPDVTITNSGDIVLEGKFGRGISVADSDNSAPGGLQVTNSGLINLSGITDHSIGIRTDTKLRKSSEREAIITNSGEIRATVTGGNETGTLGGINIRLGMYDGSEVRNSAGGVISLSHDGTFSQVSGMSVYFMTDRSSITNAGTISLNAGQYAFGIDVGAMFKYETSGLAKIENSGTITVNALDGGSYGIKVGFTGEVDDPFAITNSGTITATVNDEADAYGFAVYSGDHTWLHVTNTPNGKIYGNVDLSSHSTLTNAGLISLPYNANMDNVPASVGTFVNNATGILEIGLLTDGTTTTHSQLNTTNATFEDGSTIKVNVLAASTNVDLLVGTTLNDVVSASNALTINGTLNVTDTSLLLDFEYVEDGETIDLVATEAIDASGNEITIVSSTVSGGGTSNAQSAARALQTVQDSGIPSSMTGFYTALNTLTTGAEVAAAVESTTPATVGATVTANSQIMNGIQGIVEMRQNNVLGGMNSGDTTITDKNLWAKVYGSRGSQDDKNGVRGFDVKAFGFGIGADAEIAPRSRVGAALFYTDADVDVNSVKQNSDVKVYTALVYGNVPMNTNTDFLYQAGYSWQKTESDRNVFGIGNVSSDYTAKTASLDLKLMQTYKMDNALTLRPLIETTYRHYSSPSYSESTGGLDVEKFTSTQLIMGAGVIAEYKTSKTDKLIADISVGYDLHHDAEAVTASFQGTSTTFETRGIDNGGWQYDIGLGYETANVLGGEINFMYNYQGQGSSFDNHVLSAKYVWKF